MFNENNIYFAVPEPPSSLQILGQEERTIYLSWEPPQGGHDMFQVSHSYFCKTRLDFFFLIVLDIMYK